MSRSQRRFIRGGMAALTAIALVSGAPPSSAAVAGPIKGIATKCLDNAAGNTANGNPIVLWDCNGAVQQQWTRPGDGTIRVQGDHCLAVKGAGTTSTTPVWLYTCDGGPAQIWTPRPNGTLVNNHSGLCLASSNAGTSNGNPIWVYTCDAGPAQIWSVPAAGAGPPSGQAMPVGDLPGWRQVFTDDFTTNVPLGSFPAAVSSKWTAYANGTDTFGTGWYAPDKVVSVRDGMMNLYLHTEGSQHLVSAPLPIIAGHVDAYHGHTYGRYAVRFRADPVPGYKTAWLLWPDSDVWADGEIDFPEGSLNGSIEAFLHYRGNPTAQDQHHTNTGYGNWHTAVVEWTPTAVRFLLDGVLIGASTNPAVITNSSMHWVLQTETGPTPPSNTAAGNVQIDWVAIWSRS